MKKLLFTFCLLLVPDGLLPQSHCTIPHYSLLIGKINYCKNYLFFFIKITRYSLMEKGQNHGKIRSKENLVQVQINIFINSAQFLRA